VVCFKDMASSVLNQKWYTDRCTDVDSESERIVIAAAKLIHAQIREADHSYESYPMTGEFDNVESAKKWIPSLLSTFMEHVIGVELKRLAVSHAIVQAVKPRSAISPVLFGVALDHAFGLKWLVEMLPKLGFSISYDEVNRYKQSVVQLDESSHLPRSFPNGFTQWSGDNVDHNVNSLDGSGALHAMGLLSMTTSLVLSSGSVSEMLVPRLPLCTFSEMPIPRLQHVNVASLVKGRGIELISYCAPEKLALASVLFKPLKELKLPDMDMSSIFPLDLLWRIGWFICES